MLLNIFLNESTLGSLLAKCWLCLVTLLTGILTLSAKLDLNVLRPRREETSSIDHHQCGSVWCWKCLPSEMRTIRVSIELLNCQNWFQSNHNNGDQGHRWLGRDQGCRWWIQIPWASSSTASSGWSISVSFSGLILMKLRVFSSGSSRHGHSREEV